jgi:hypothetical protein
VAGEVARPEWEIIMKPRMHLLVAGAVALAPTAILAGPGHGGGHGGQGATMGQGRMGGEVTRMGHPIHSSQGPTNGVGWDHMNGPTHPTGQPGFECEANRPGHASSAPGSAFNEDGKAGTRYAGEQPQNSRNTSSVSQYDTACLHQPH